MMQREEVKRVTMKQTIDGSVGNPFENSVEENFRSLGMSIYGIKAIGATMSLAELMGGQPQATPSSGGHEAPALPAPASGGGGAFSFGFAVPGLAPSPAPAAGEAGAAGSDSNGGAGGKKGRGSKRASSDNNAGAPGSKRAFAQAGQPDDKKKPAGPGRPKRNLSEEMQKFLAEFRDSPEADSTFYGENFRTRERNTKRLLADVDQRMRAQDCSVEEAVDLATDRKRVAGVLHISKFVSTHGFASDGFPKMFAEQLSFLNLDPVARVEFPKFVLRHKHEGDIRSSTPIVFFQHLACSAMTKHGFDLNEVVEGQKTLIIERLVSLTKNGVSADVSSKLKAQFPSMKYNSLVGAGLTDDTLPTQLSHVVLLINRDSCWSKDVVCERSLSEFVQALEQAVGISEQKGSIANALTMYPNGRAEVAAAELLCVTASATSKQVRDVLASSKELSDVAGNMDAPIESFTSGLTKLAAVITLAPGVDAGKVGFLCRPALLASTCLPAALSAVLDEVQRVASPLLTDGLSLGEWLHHTAETRPLTLASASAALACQANLQKDPWQDEAVLGSLCALAFFKDLLVLFVQAAGYVSETPGLSKAMEFRKQVGDLMTAVDDDKDLRANVDDAQLDHIKHWFEQFWSQSGKPLASHTTQELHDACSAKLEPLISSAKANLGEPWSLTALWAPRAAPEQLESWQAWEWAPDFGSDLVAFARDKGDAQLSRQLVFILAVQKVMRSASLCCSLLAAAVDWETRNVTEKVVGLVIHLRLCLVDFECLCQQEGDHLSTLFEPKSSSMAFHASCLDNKCNAKDFAGALRVQARSVISEFAAMWACDLSAMKAKMNEWIPPNWTLQRDSLCLGTSEESKTVREAMLSNKNIAKLSAMASLMHTTLEFVKRVNGEGKELGMMVDAALHKECDIMCRHAIDTVVTSFALYELLFKITRVVNLKMRQAACNKLKVEVESKGVVMGEDMMSHMDRLRSPDFKVQDEAGSPDTR